MTETTSTETFEPKQWNANGDQIMPAPWIPTFHGLRHDQYRDALTSVGLKAGAEDNAGRGYGEQITVITDPFTGAVGYVTEWEWNSRVEWGTWTPDGNFEQRGKSDTHTWMWDAVKMIRHTMTCAAFKAAHDAGELIGYWAQAQDRDAANAANEEWVAARIAANRR